MYDQYGFDKNGYNKYGRNVYGFDKWGLNKNYYDMYGFDEEGLNEDGLNKFGYKRKLGKGLNIIALPFLLSKICTNNISKEQIKNIKQLVDNLYNTEQITKQVYNILNKALMSMTFIKNDL